MCFIENVLNGVEAFIVCFIHNVLNVFILEHPSIISIITYITWLLVVRP